MKPRLARITLGLAVLVFTLAVLIAAAGPLGATRALERRLSELIGRTVTIGDLRIAPWSGAVTLVDLRVHSPGGREPILSWQRLRVRPSLTGFLRGEIAIAAARIESLHLRAQRGAAGWDFQDILERFRRPGVEDAGKQSQLRPVRIDALSLRELRIDLIDTTGGIQVAHAYGPLEADVHDVRTEVGREGRFQLTGALGGGSSLHVDATFRIDRRTATFRVRVSDLPLPPYAAYVPDSLDVGPAAGRLDVSTIVQIEHVDERAELSLNSTSVSVRNLDLRTKEGAPLLSASSAMLSDGFARITPRQCGFGTFQVRGLALHLHRRDDGSFAGLGQSESEAPRPTPDTGPAPAPWTVASGETTFEDCRIAWRDDTVGTQFETRIQRATLAPMQTAEARAEFEVTLQTTANGMIHAGGTYSKHEGGMVALHVEDLPLSPFSPYMERASGVLLARGVADGRLEFSLDASGPARVRGSASLDGVSLARGNTLELAWERLSLEELDWQRSPPRFAVARVRLEEPLATFRWNSAPEPAPEAPAATPAPPEERDAIALEFPRVEVAGASVRMVDAAPSPPVEFDLREGSVVIDGLTSASDSLATVAADARIGATGRLEVRGRTNPLAPALTTDLQATARGVDLRPADPYFQRFVGYALASANLRFDLRYTIDQRRLRAQNVLYLDRFALGRATPNPDATPYPVGLAVALLRDRSGTIKIDLPIEGSLDDPSFRLGRVVLRALGNILESAATAPFRLLGNLLPGGRADDAVREDFPPGQSDLAPAQVQTLHALAAVLADRPGLPVAIVAGVDPRVDGESLLRAAHAAAVRRLVWNHQGRTGEPDAEFAPTSRQRDAALLAWLALQQPDAAARGDARLAAERFAATVDLEPDALAKLAAARAAAVSAILEAGGVDPTRIRQVVTPVHALGARAEIRLE